jgi:hypothetical protein
MLSTRPPFFSSREKGAEGLSDEQLPESASSYLNLAAAAEASVVLPNRDSEISMKDFLLFEFVHYFTHTTPAHRALLALNSSERLTTSVSQHTMLTVAACTRPPKEYHRSVCKEKIPSLPHCIHDSGTLTYPSLVTCDH